MAQGSATPSDPRPIDAVESLWTEELTWMETRAAVELGPIEKTLEIGRKLVD